MMECLKTTFIRKLELVQQYTLPGKAASYGLQKGPRTIAFASHPLLKSQIPCISAAAIHQHHPLFWSHIYWRSFIVLVSLDEEASTFSDEDVSDNTEEVVLNNESEKLLTRRLTSDELNALMADSERKRLIKKLSEANQYNRFLKRQLHAEKIALTKFKSDLTVLELELQALVGLAEELANSDVQLTSRKINGKYIQSHLFSRLEATHKRIKEQVKDIDTLKLEEVTIFWGGMAECVQIMGSFDGWTQGEEMSPEYDGGFARFSATLKLRPGRYEIKFLVDGEWQLSPVFPTVGEGMMMNNLLVVE